jgi:uncharacterized protein (DUF2384 family)
MHVSFVRTGRRRYAVHADREQARRVVMDPAPGYHDHIPHDLVHFFVETHWGLRHGVYGLLAVGGDAHTFIDPHGSMRERRRMQAKNRLSGSDVGRSERLAGLVQHAWQIEHGEARAPVSADVMAELEVDPDELALAVQDLDRLARSWHGLQAGGRLRLAWPWPERRVKSGS